MTIEEALKALKDGKKIRRKQWRKGDYYQIDTDGKKFINKSVDGYSVFIMLNTHETLADDWEIVEEPVLDKQEKNYLENLLRPYTKRYDKILIMKTSVDSSRFYILITFYAFKDDADYADYVNLPYFDKDEHMYEKMEAEKFYTLDELGLFK